jgi:hypothetical protein
MTEHTPTPWTIYDDADPLKIAIKGIRRDIGGAHVATVLSHENATFLLKAVNNHEALVKALREIGLACDGPLSYSRSHLADKVAEIARTALLGLNGAVGESHE